MTLCCVTQKLLVQLGQQYSPAGQLRPRRTSVPCYSVPVLDSCVWEDLGGGVVN